jgi:hypothetical protein
MSYELSLKVRCLLFFRCRLPARVVFGAVVQRSRLGQNSRAGAVHKRRSAYSEHQRATIQQFYHMDPQIPKLPGYSVSIPVSALHLHLQD